MRHDRPSANTKRDLKVPAGARRGISRHRLLAALSGTTTNEMICESIDDQKGEQSDGDNRLAIETS